MPGAILAVPRHCHPDGTEIQCIRLFQNYIKIMLKFLQHYVECRTYIKMIKNFCRNLRAGPYGAHGTGLQDHMVLDHRITCYTGTSLLQDHRTTWYTGTGLQNHMVQDYRTTCCRALGSHGTGLQNHMVQDHRTTW